MLARRRWEAALGFAASWGSLVSRPLPSLEPQDSGLHCGLDEVRHRALAALADCSGADCDRLRWRVKSAPNAHELWLLRGALFQLVSSQHCQATAAERINSMVPAFREFLPEKLVTLV